MSDVPEDLDMTKLSIVGSDNFTPPEEDATIPVHPTKPMQSPEVPYPVAAPLNPGDPAPTLNHYPWTPLPLAPVDVAPVTKLELPAAPPPPPPPPVPVGPQPSPNFGLVAPLPPPPPPPPVPVAPPVPVPIAVAPVAPVAPPQPLAVHAPVQGPQGATRPPEVPHVNIEHIYSDNTREVWRALAPSKPFGLFLLASIGLIIFVAYFLLQNSGLSIYEVPIIRDTLNLE